MDFLMQVIAYLIGFGLVFGSSMGWLVFIWAFVYDWLQMHPIWQPKRQQRLRRTLARA